MWSSTSVLKPLRSAQRMYIRSSMSAQSWASVPPVPAWTDTSAFFLSYGAGQHQLEFEVVELLVDRGELGLDLGPRVGVVGLLGQLQQHLGLVDALA